MGMNGYNRLKNDFDVNYSYDHESFLMIYIVNIKLLLCY